MTKYVSFLITIFLLSCSAGALAASAAGRIEQIRNSKGNVDNFVVQLKSGWTRGGCTGGTVTESLSITFTPGQSINRKAFNRSFSLALAAQAKGRSVTIYQSGTTCTADAYGIWVNSN